MTTRTVPGAVADAVWRALHLGGRLSTSEMKEISGGTRKQVLDYMAGLERAGFVRRDGGTANPMWLALPTRRSGPRPPVVQTVTITVVFDPNTGETRT